MKNPFSSFWTALKGTFGKSDTASQAGEGCSIAAVTGDEAIRLRGTAAPWTKARARAARSQWGFTLIELLVVITVLAIIAAFIGRVLK